MREADLQVNETGIGRHWMRWAWVLGVCTLFILINSSTLYLGFIYGLFPGTRPMTWRELFFEQMIIWYPVGLLAPINLWLSRRFRLERERWLQSFPLHLLFSLAFNLGYVLISGSLMRLAWGESLIPRPFFQYYGPRMISRIPFSLIIYWSLLGASYAFDYYRKYREQELQASQLEARLIEAQLQTLKMQLHPHFLFNTLHAISALMDEDIKAARRMIARLSELLRLTLENAGQQEVSLRQELDALERYLEIEQIRFQDRLRVQLAIDPETLGARVPNLILQPIVENAVRHGIAPSSSSNRIEIRAARRDGMIELQVRDDGPGLAEGEAFALKEGIGLANTRARLRQLYGEAYRFEIKNAAGGGLLVTLAFPFQPALEAADEQ